LCIWLIVLLVKLSALPDRFPHKLNCYKWYPIVDFLVFNILNSDSVDSPQEAQVWTKGGIPGLVDW
jgi:hypothetical protein